MCDGITGKGATVAFDQTAAIGVIQSIQLPEWVMEKVDFTGLDVTEFRCYKPGDVTDPGDVVMTVFFDPRVDVPPNGVIETITVTLPKLDAAAASAGIFAGTGFITSKALPNLALNEAATYDLTFSFDGETGPTFTVEPAPV